MTQDTPHTATARVEAPTLDEALALAADELGVGVRGLAHTIEQEGARGFLGIGRKDCILTASVTVGTIRYHVTPSGAFLRIVPPLTFVQAERGLTSHGVALERSCIERALAAAPDIWFRVGDGHPHAAKPAAHVTISEDEMSVTLEMAAPAEDGETFDPEEIVKLLQEYGVTRGIDHAAIADALDHERFDENIVVARGEPPHDGADAVIHYRFRTDKSHVLLVADDHGHIDFHDIGLFEDVTVGQVLAESTPAQRAGKAGWTVTDKALPARDGVGEVTLKAGPNTLLSADGRTLTSSLAGQVLFVGGVVSVAPVQDIKGNVDFSTGNIDSRGSVIVRGDVAEGFHVRADGNIDVHGLVEAAQLAAKGDVVVHRGVLGRGLAKIDAGGDVFAKFADRVTIHAGRDAIIGGEILTSDVRAGRHIKCEGLHGAIIGGRARAAETVIAATMGSRICVATSIEAGVSVSGTKVIFPGVRLTIHGAKLEILDEERAKRFVELEGAVVRADR